VSAAAVMLGQTIPLRIAQCGLDMARLLSHVVRVKREFLEHVAEASEEWSLSRSAEFIAGYKDPWPVLHALHKDKCLTLVDRNGNSLPARKAEEIFRNWDASVGTEVIVKVTEEVLKGQTTNHLTSCQR
jgi:hypothetical protein